MPVFQYPIAFLLLLALIPLGLLFWAYLRWRDKAINKLGIPSLIEQLSPQASPTKLKLRAGLILVALASLIIAVANPQSGTTYEKVQRSGVDLIVALDISRSMLSQDVKPSRLDRARQFISNLTDKLAGDRIGLIVFAGNAYRQIPLTSDYAGSKLLLKNVSPRIAPTQGTAIGKAIRMAIEAFETSGKNSRVLLIISDGENHEGDAIEATKEAKKEGIAIYTMGVGTIQGGRIPQIQNGRQIGYMSKDGEVILSKLNEDMLKDIADKAKGDYFRLEGGSGYVNKFRRELATQEQNKFEDHIFTDYEDNYQYFLGFALLLLAIELFLTDRKSSWLNEFKLFNKQKIESSSGATPL